MTDEKTMREYLMTAQKWQRQAMLRGKADVSIETRVHGKLTTLGIDVYLRTDDGELMKDENGELVRVCKSLYYFYDVEENNATFEVISDFLTNHKAI